MTRKGDTAPAVETTASDGEPFRLADHRGSWLVLYFYPRSFTPGCTIEAKGFRDHRAEIEALGATVVGVSIDDHDTQCRFMEHHGLGFRLLADEDGSITRDFGVKRPLMNSAKRVTFVIDPEGKVAARFQHELRFGRHIEDVLAFLKSAQGGA